MDSKGKLDEDPPGRPGNYTGNSQLDLVNWLIKKHGMSEPLCNMKALLLGNSSTGKQLNH